MLVAGNGGSEGLAGVAGSEMERLAPAVLVEIGGQIVVSVDLQRCAQMCPRSVKIQNRREDLSWYYHVHVLVLTLLDLGGILAHGILALLEQVIVCLSGRSMHAYHIVISVQSCA